MKQGFCKNTGSQIVGTCESIHNCTAWISGFDENGEVEYAGETEVNWDEQTQDKDENGELLFVTEGGDIVPLSQIEFREEGDDEEGDEE